MAASGAAFSCCRKYLKPTTYLYQVNIIEKLIFFVNVTEIVDAFGTLWTMGHFKTALAVAFSWFTQLERNCCFDSLPITDTGVESNVVNIFLGHFHSTSAAFNGNSHML